jgi:hypothetical protein
MHRKGLAGRDCGSRLSASKSHTLNDEYMTRFEDGYQAVTGEKISMAPVEVKSAKGSDMAIRGYTSPFAAITPDMRRGPVDPAGVQFEVSDRNLFCMDVNASTGNFVVGGAGMDICLLLCIEYTLDAL